MREEEGRGASEQDPLDVATHSDRQSYIQNDAVVHQAVRVATTASVRIIETRHIKSHHRAGQQDTASIDDCWQGLCDNVAGLVMDERSL